MQFSKIELCFDISLLHRLAIPFNCFTVILIYSISVSVHKSKIVLGLCKSLLCCLAIPFRGFRIFFPIKCCLPFFKHLQRYQGSIIRFIFLQSDFFICLRQQIGQLIL